VLLTDDPRRIVDSDCDVIIELIGGEDEAGDVIEAALRAGRDVITANKAVIAARGPSLHALAERSGARLAYSAAVGGALPAIEAVHRLREHHSITSIEGVLNGTSNFILDRLGAGAAYDDALLEAQAAGFAEADPTLDVRGGDAAQKLAILAHHAFDADVPHEQADCQGIDALDPTIVQEARNRGGTLRLVCTAQCDGDDDVRLSVRPIVLAPEHPLANPRGAGNVLLIRTDDGGTIAVAGKGAGRWPTTLAVVADLLDLQRGRQHTSESCAPITTNGHARSAHRPATVIARDPDVLDDPHGAASIPIYQTATFRQPSAIEPGRFDYSRSGNPTRAVLEVQLAQLEQGEHGFAFASGMAALSAITQLLRPGQEILAGDDLYGGTYRLLAELVAPLGINVRYCDTTDLDAVNKSIGERTRLVLIETPTNPFLKVCDIRAIARITHRHGALLAVDNTMLSPYLQRPLELGADLVVHSATKYLSGHSDLTAGAIVTSDEELTERIGFIHNAVGSALAPFDSWLLLRGLKTLAVRVERQQETAQRLAEFLNRHPLVQRVYFPGLDEHEGSELNRRQADGPGAVFSFNTGSVDLSERIIGALELFGITVSFGGASSTISLPCRMSHASIPAADRAARALPEDLVRVAVGLEDPDDLEDDLRRALATVRYVSRTEPAVNGNGRATGAPHQNGVNRRTSARSAPPSSSTQSRAAGRRTVLRRGRCSRNAGNGACASAR
jgi:cystathionine beta-lyase